jgi:serine/threonine protein phosphatase 1
MRWIIGDIHGMRHSLQSLIAAIDAADKKRELLFVGDYVNRGPASRGVIDLLLSLDNARFVRGNHDDVFDQVISGVSFAGRPGEDHRSAAFQWFMQHGLDKTFLSYGVSESDLKLALKRPTTLNLDMLVDKVPRAHRQFIRSLPLTIEMNDMFVLHAKWDPFMMTTSPSIEDRAAGSEALRYSLIWGRYRVAEIETEKNWERPGYFGHTPVDSYSNSREMLPVLGPRITLLDTACALVPHGRLTAWCHETGEFIQADPSGNIVGAR